MLWYVKDNEAFNGKWGWFEKAKHNICIILTLNQQIGQLRQKIIFYSKFRACEFFIKLKWDEMVNEIYF